MLRALIHADDCAGWTDPGCDFEGCDCAVGEVESLRAELAAVKAERDAALARATDAEATLDRVWAAALELDGEGPYSGAIRDAIGSDK